MNTTDRWDSLIQYWTEQIWPDADWRLVKCQIRQESTFNPQSVSSCGAIGLLQIMPATGQYLGVSREKLFNPETNLKTGIAYLKQQYDRFPEIPDPQERLKFALASYNGGRGYINRAIALARKEDVPWQTWDGVKPYLAAADCTVGGKHPDHRQIVTYVGRIWEDYARCSPAPRSMDHPAVDSPPAVSGVNNRLVLPVAERLVGNILSPITEGNREAGEFSRNEDDDRKGDHEP